MKTRSHLSFAIAIIILAIGVAYLTSSCSKAHHISITQSNKPLAFNEALEKFNHEVQNNMIVEPKNLPWFNITYAALPSGNNIMYAIASQKGQPLALCCRSQASISNMLAHIEFLDSINTRKLPKDYTAYRKVSEPVRNPLSQDLKKYKLNEMRWFDPEAIKRGYVSEPNANTMIWVDEERNQFFYCWLSESE